jgi:hypothetical protein
MSWNDWEAAWRRQEPPVGATADVETVKQSFEANRRKLARTVLMRNVIEGGTGIVLTPVMVLITLHYGGAGWPLAISTALLFGVTCVFIVDLVRSFRRRVGPGASMLAKIDAEIAELRHQRRLISTWWAWYLVPGVAAGVIGLVTLGRLNYGESPPGFLTNLLTTPITLAWIIVLVAIPSYFLCGVWRDLRKAIKNVQLRLDELEKLRRYLLSEDVWTRTSMSLNT